jgi:hypothetical protein
MSFSIGIVGLPNVGKSTLFTAITKKKVDAANYPFCTIEPNVGVVAVPDERLDQLTTLYSSAKTVPTTIEFVDIAGLVKGASEGQGLGNKFLAHIREVDAIIEVVRNFKDPNVIHVDGRVNPEEDIKTINLELILADLETVSKRLERQEKQSKGTTDKTLLLEIVVLKKLKECLASEQLAISLNFTAEEKLIVAQLGLLTFKPFLYVHNIDEQEINSFTATQGIAICAKLEADLADLSPEETTEYLNAAGLTKTGLDQLIIASYELLGLITFFTAGPKESHAWTITKGSTAPQAAGKIHTDFEKGFIKAEIVNWQDLVKAGGEAKAKELGLVKTEGKGYLVQDGDCAYFLFK